MREELSGSDYRDPWLESAVRWVLDVIRRLLDGIGLLTGLSPVVTVLLALVVVALLAWALPRVRRESTVSAAAGAVLNDTTTAPRHYRDRAAKATREGRYDEAVLDGFRAIAKEMSDRALLADAPGRTAHEISVALASPFPDHAARLAEAANLFDSVRYGRARATASQAIGVQQLDASLVSTRPVQARLPLQDLPA